MFMHEPLTNSTLVEGKGRKTGGSLTTSWTTLHGFTYLFIVPSEVLSRTVLQGSPCGWEVMTPSMKEAGSGQTALLSDMFAGPKVNVNLTWSDKFSETISFRKTTFFLVHFLTYFTGNPDDYFGEDCLSMYINDGYWNDDVCEYKRGYICKKRGEMLAMALYSEDRTDLMKNIITENTNI